MNQSKIILRSIIILCLFAACSGGKKEEQDTGEIVYPPEIAAIINYATAGAIEPTASIEVTFVDEVVGDSLVDQEVPGVFEFSPHLDGKTYWRSPNQLVFEPARPLTPWTNYTATLDLEALNQDFEVAEFPMKFYVQGQQVISFAGDLQLFNPSDPKKLVYQGSIKFSQPADLEQVKAGSSFSGLDLNWTQEGDKKFTFISEVIDRGDQEAGYQFSINAAMLNLQEDMVQGVNVVPLQAMQVIDIQTNESDKTPKVMIKFSDQLDKDQNIDGFVAVAPAVDFSVQKMGQFLLLTGDFKFGTTYTVEISKGLKSKWGTQTDQQVSQTIAVADLPPQVQFASTGIFMPTSNDKTLQFLTANLSKVHVEIKKVFGNEFEEFFRREEISSAKNRNSEFNYSYVSSVGAIIYNQTLDIGTRSNEWLLHNLDLTGVFDTYTNGLYLIRINFNPSDVLTQIPEEKLTYIQQKGQVYKPFTVSDIGIIAKYADGQYHVWVTDLTTAKPKAGVQVTVADYSNIRSGVTNQAGFANITAYQNSFIKAEKDGQISIIHPYDMRWNTSGFDVTGVSHYDLKTRAYTYTERGVYRPGDSINLSCIVRFHTGAQSNVPATLSLYNPEGTLVKQTTQKGVKDGFYTFKLATDPNAPTGNWNAYIQVGNKNFYHDLKIETVVANRLKVKVVPNKKIITSKDTKLSFEVESKFLFGAPAKKLAYHTEVQFYDINDPFPAYKNYLFSDAQVQFERARKKIAAGKLDEEGKAAIAWNLPNLKSASTPLKAKIIGSVQEDGGRPNDSWTYVDVHPFSHYVGIDREFSYIKLNSAVDIPVVVVDHTGKAVAGREVAYRIYRNDSYWWYQYNSYSHFKHRFKTDKHTYLVEEGTFMSGKPTAKLPVQLNQSGEYLIEVQDAVYQGHTASFFTSVYPYGAIPSGNQNEGTLVVKSEKSSYEVGEQVTVSFPSPRQGNVLFTLEQGDKILKREWIDPDSEATMKVTFEVTPEMAPNVYATLTAIQPHAQTVNDRPIRMFGILPIGVVNAKTQEDLAIVMKDQLKPREKFTVNVKTRSDKPTQLTVAVVDEGLLDLTNQPTPDPWAYFFKKISLGVITYDLFGHVIGANKGDVFKLFSIGGDEDYREAQLDPFERKKRFKPVSMFKGPIRTDASGRASVTFDMPNYVGSVRVMVVSASGDRYGKAEKTVPVKSDLIVLPTLPRVLKPGDECKVPVNVFATRSGIGKVSVQLALEGPLEATGVNTQQVHFSEEGDQMLYYNVKVKEAIGQGKVTITARGGGARSISETDIAISPSSARVYTSEEKTITPGETVTLEVPKLGLDGTNHSRFYIAPFPHMDFLDRVDWLIRYPYGCLEQSVSSAYPQLALRQLLSGEARPVKEIDQNIDATIARLSLFQLSDGSFSYWPGGNSTSAWGTNYAVQFLIAAKNKGYAIPSNLLEGSIRYLQRATRHPESADKPRWLMNRVNRCYVLALAGKAPLSEMNVLLQNHFTKMRDVEKWQLIAAYKLAGAVDKVKGQVEQIKMETEEYTEFSYTYGSKERDMGLILTCLVLLDREEDAALLAKALAKLLSEERWYATHTQAYMLLGLADYFDYAGISTKRDVLIQGAITYADGTVESVNTANTFKKYVGHNHGKSLKFSLDNNLDVSKLYISISSNGVPLEDQTPLVSKNLSISVDWFDEDGQGIDISSVKQGDSFYGRYRVKNNSVLPTIEEVALVQLLPSGWELENMRLTGESLPAWMSDYRVGAEEYVDIRDDRIMWFFDIHKEPLDFIVKVNAVSSGTFMLPGTRCEAMYNRDFLATQPAKKVRVN